MLFPESRKYRKIWFADRFSQPGRSLTFEITEFTEWVVVGHGSQGIMGELSFWAQLERVFVGVRTSSSYKF